MPWIVILALTWGNPDSRIQGSVGDVIKIERIQVATKEQCEEAAQGWTHKYNYNNRGKSGYAEAFATCAGQEPATK
jgi:hypothetical protein